MYIIYAKHGGPLWRKLIITFKMIRNSIHYDVESYEIDDVMYVADVKIAPGVTSHFRQIVHFYDSNIRQKFA